MDSREEMFVLKAGLPKGQLVHIVLIFCGARLPISVLLGSLTGGSFLMINTAMGGGAASLSKQWFVGVEFSR